MRYEWAMAMTLTLAWSCGRGGDRETRRTPVAPSDVVTTAADTPPVPEASPSPVPPSSPSDASLPLPASDDAGSVAASPGEQEVEDQTSVATPSAVPQPSVPPGCIDAWNELSKVIPPDTVLIYREEFQGSAAATEPPLRHLVSDLDAPSHGAWISWTVESGRVGDSVSLIHQRILAREDFLGACKGDADPDGAVVAVDLVYGGLAPVSYRGDIQLAVEGAIFTASVFGETESLEDAAGVAASRTTSILFRHEDGRRLAYPSSFERQESAGESWHGRRVSLEAVERRFRG